MKTSKFHLFTIALLIGLSFSACKKSESTTNVDLTGKEAAVSQDAESQDAQADNIDQSTDNIADALETNNFSAVKSATTGGPSWTVDHPDTTYFPKVITLTFNTDTLVGGEKFSQKGVITIKVELTVANAHPWRNYVKRTITFTNFTTANDSSSFTINGTRTMTRKQVSITPAITLNNILTLTKLRLSATDEITSDLTFNVTSGSYSGSFTRQLNRTRQAIAHFEKITNTSIWHQIYSSDTLIYKGSATGTNLIGVAYTRTISDSDPITFTRCNFLIPVIASGTITQTVSPSNGSKDVTVQYSKLDCATVVTVKVNGEVKKVFTRKATRGYKKWW